ncbi:MAG: LysR family transcriptional regulator ArgP [Proteobacteria bacterium]|nr:LysR family transcriptional regulator ArgP [Pseudomonadota bacterium]MBS0572553.1 LysR family transcriptional regulator ArgP [Pseudomonadota bacterium]
MFDRDQLRALAAVLHEGSFDAAARALNVTPSAISQRIRALEEAAGAALVVRGPPARPTATGARLARHAADLTLIEAGLARDLGLARPARPALRIAVNADSLASWFLDAMERLDGPLFDLVIDDEGHSAEWLRRGEVQGAVTSDGRAVPGCDCRALGALRYLATATPGFAARWFADGVTAAALSAAPALEFNAKDRLQRDWVRGLTGQAPALPCHRIASPGAFVEATLRGLGWGMNPECLVAPAIAAGRLVALAPDRPLDVALFWQVARLPGDALGPLTSAVRAAAGRVLRPV